VRTLAGRQSVVAIETVAVETVATVTPQQLLEYRRHCLQRQPPVEISKPAARKKQRNDENRECNTKTKMRLYSIR
jgi:hypothetical protein